MKVSQIMTVSAQTILPDATAEQASRKLREYNVGLLPVVEDGNILGVLTDRDIVVRSVAEGRNPHLTTVRELMTPAAITCYEDQSITEAARIMEKNHIRRLVVLNRQNILAGVLTITDLARSTVKEKVSGHVLHKVSESQHKPSESDDSWVPSEQ